MNTQDKKRQHNQPSTIEKVSNMNTQLDNHTITTPSLLQKNNRGVEEQQNITSIGYQPDPFDPAQFAVHSTISGGVGVIKELVTCPVRKPNKQEFFRVHPDQEYQLQSYVLELNDEQEIYLVMPSVATEIPREVRVVSLRLAINRNGSVFVWPLPIPGIDGRDNPWWRSARAAALRAEKAWTRIISNNSGGSYDVYVATVPLPEPEWPDKSLSEILKIAFGDRFIIRNSDHPVIQRLMGLA